MTEEQSNWIKKTSENTSYDGSTYGDEIIVKILLSEEWKQYDLMEARMFLGMLMDRKDIASKYNDIRPIYKVYIMFKQAVELYNNINNKLADEDFIVLSHTALNKLLIVLIGEKDCKDSKGKILGFESLIIKAKSLQIISKQEYELLDELNNNRNKVAHNMPFSLQINREKNYAFFIRILNFYNKFLLENGYNPKFTINQKLLSLHQGIIVEDNELVSEPISTNTGLSLGHDEMGSVIIDSTGTSVEAYNKSNKNFLSFRKLKNAINGLLPEDCQLTDPDLIEIRKALKLYKSSDINKDYYDSCNIAKEIPYLNSKFVAYNSDHYYVSYSKFLVPRIVKLVKEVLNYDLTILNKMRKEKKYFDNIEEILK